MGTIAHAGLGITMQFYVVPALIVATNAILSQGQGLEDELKNELSVIKNEITNQIDSTQRLVQTEIEAELNEVKSEITEVKNEITDKIDSTAFKTEMAAACCTEYKFAPTYSGFEDSCPDCQSLRWRRSILSPNSAVKCVRNIGRKRDACREFQRNKKLIKEIRCSKCKYVRDINTPGLPELDMSTCECRITKGEMASGVLRRNQFSLEIERDDNGVEKRDKSEFQVARNPDDNSPMIQVVRDADGGANIGSSRPQYRVEVTIEECPVVTSADGTVKLDKVTGKKVRACYGDEDVENVEKDLGPAPKDPVTSTPTATTSTPPPSESSGWLNVGSMLGGANLMATSQG